MTNTRQTAEKWFLSRQSYASMGADEDEEYVVELAAGGLDYANPGMLVDAYPKLGEGQTYTDPREALEAAFAIRAAWTGHHPGLKVRIETGHTAGFTLPFLSYPDDDELRQWADQEWALQPKCGRCGELITDGQGWYHEFSDDNRFCSEYCSEEDWATFVEPDEEED